MSIADANSQAATLAALDVIITQLDRMQLVLLDCARAVDQLRRQETQRALEGSRQAREAAASLIGGV